jgi:hypothetical protein
MIKAVCHGISQVGDRLIFIEIDEVLALAMRKNRIGMINCSGSCIRRRFHFGPASSIHACRTTVCQYRIECVSVIHGSGQSRVGRTITHDEGIDCVVISQFCTTVACKLAERCVSDTRYQEIAIDSAFVARPGQLLNDNTGDRT